MHTSLNGTHSAPASLSVAPRCGRACRKKGVTCGRQTCAFDAACEAGRLLDEALAKRGAERDAAIHDWQHAFGVALEGPAPPEPEFADRAPKKSRSPRGRIGR